MLTKDDLAQIRGVVKEEIQAEVVSLKKDVQILRKDVSKIRKDVGTIVNYFDREYIELRQRIENIENHLGITYSSN